MRSFKKLSGAVETSANYINITSFSDYPYYPQYFQICIYSPTVGGNKGCIQIKLKDCDGDDTSCEDYHGVGQVTTDTNVEARASTTTLATTIYRMQVYTLMGSLVYQGKPKPMLELIQARFNQVFVCIYYDEAGNILETQKYLHIQ